jgi:ABC-type glycerol-3-phosphate transport system substrate-binding protein
VRRGSGLTRRRFLATSATVAAGAVAGAGATAALAASPAAAQPKGPATVSLWYIAQGPVFEATIKAAVKDFEDKHPSIKVTLDAQPTVDMRNKIRPIFANGGPGPDVLYEGGPVTLTYAAMPFGFIDVSERVKAAGLKDKTPRSAWIPLEMEGKTFGVPMNAYPFLMGYNKDMYAAAGLKGVPQTWEEQLAFVRKLWDPKKDTFGFVTFTNRFVAWLFETLLYDSGIGYVRGSEQWTRFDMSQPITFNSPQAVRALEYLRDLAETAPGGLKGNIGIDSAKAIVMFSRGNLGHYHGHSIHFSQITRNNPKMIGGKNFDVYVFPKGPVRQGAQFSASVMGITRGSKDQDAAWEFVRFISDQWEGPLSSGIGTVAVRRDAKLPADAPRWLVDAGRQALAGDAFPSAFFPQLDSVREPLGKEVEAFFLGQKTAQQALDSTAAVFTRTLKG